MMCHRRLPPSEPRLNSGRRVDSAICLRVVSGAVFLTLTRTWMAAPAPYGPDIHPNAAGYAVIAGAFLVR
jgi:hypothetical protein